MARILIIDDVPMVREILREMLEEGDHDVLYLETFKLILLNHSVIISVRSTQRDSLPTLQGEMGRKIGGYSICVNLCMLAGRFSGLSQVEFLPLKV